MAKKKQLNPRKYAPRQTRKFQLRLDHEQDRYVQEVLDFAKTERREVTVIRDSVTLYWALEQGNLDALFQMFPQYKAQFAPSATEAMEQFMQILQRQQVVQAPTPVAGPKQIAAPSFDMPSLEDDDQPTLILNKATTGTNGGGISTFINAARSLE